MNIKTKIRDFLLIVVEFLNKKIDIEKETRYKKKFFLKKEIKIDPILNFVFIYFFVFYILLNEINFEIKRIMGLSIFLLILVFSTFFYCRKICRRIIYNQTNMMIFDLLLVFAIGLIKILHLYNFSSPYLFPIAAFAILATILIDYKSAILLFFIIEIIYVVIYNFNVQYFFYGLGSSCIGVYWSMNINNRKDVVKIFFPILLINLGIISSFSFLNGLLFIEIVSNILLSISNAFISIIIVLGALPFFENAFTIATNIKLLEMTDFNQPLMKKLMIEAPGTYHHSLFVGNLAESAAGLIGANTVLSKVGGYYHDIGKIIKPHYYIENQKIFKIDNKHDELNPNMSALVILSHVKEGVKLAENYNLDKSIIAFIREHHGTSIIEYFYNLAKKMSHDVDENNFRYPGPKPTTKETAIVMLADSVEAAARAMENPNHNRLKETVYNLINSKFINGQFDDAPITLKDLNKIAENMINSLLAFYHARIEYE